MKKLIFNKFDKKLIGQLPRVTFPGKIVVVQSESEANRAVKYLLSRDVLGVDTETRPSFKKGIIHQVSLLQVCDHEVCFLFRLNMIGVPEPVIKLLEDTSVPKIGLSLQDDLLMLHKRASFQTGLFIDLQHLAGDIGIVDLSLQKLYANLFGQRIRKREQLSNWENDVLTESQKLYAATDAWTCINLYEEIMRLKTTHDYELVTVPEPEKGLEQSDDKK